MVVLIADAQVVPSSSRMTLIHASQTPQAPGEALDNPGTTKALEDATKKLRDFKGALDRLSGVKLEKAMNIATAVSEVIQHCS